MKMPEQVGRYRILEEIGRGGMGCVYRAHDPALDRQVAVKMIAPHLEGEKDAENLKARFLREARLAARLDHPGIVRVFDAGVEGNTLWLVMELVEGESLAQRFGRGDMPNRAEAINLLANIAEALAAAHEAGVVHRDIKPANILLLPNGRPKVTDFGVARAVGDQTALTRTGTTVGSPAYMAPEQVRGEPVDARADLFSLGVMAYQMLLGRRPFPADTITTLVYQILNHDPLADETVLGDLGDRAASFLRRALAKDRDHRFADAAEFAAAVRALDMEGPTRAVAFETDPSIYRQPTPPPVPQASRPHVWLGAAIGVGGVFVIAVLAALLYWLVWLPTTTAVPPGSEPSTQAALQEESVDPGTPRSMPPPAAPPLDESTPPSPTPVGDDTGPRTGGSIAARPTPTSPPRPSTIPAGPVPTVLPTPTRPPLAPTAVPTPTAPVIPPPPPTPTSTATPQPTATPTPPPIEELFACRRGAEFHVDPEEALVTIDGKELGIADDWDGRGGGETYYFTEPGRYLVKLSCPGWRTTWIRITVTEYAVDDVVDVDTELEKQR